ncbi:MAG: cell division protein FtsX [Sulfurovaceae bacterium]|nr:cell division protein FtsX [Sulfurovaceae bacterium]
MKFVKNHLSIIFPMVAILLGLEFFIVFDRTTKNYEESLKNSYAMLIVAKDEMSIDDFKAWDSHVFKVSEIEKSQIVKRVNSAFNKSDEKNKKLQDKMPNFYSVKLNSYLNKAQLEEVKNNFLKSSKITRVETFDTLHQSNYGLFSFIKFSFSTFIVFMTIIGSFLIIKQMEVWNYMHSQRMKVMNIFGASLFLRSKVLINMALIDAIISAVLANIIFYFIQKSWLRDSNITIIQDNIEKLFTFSDVFTLIAAAIVIVLTAVTLVVVNVKEE